MSESAADGEAALRKSNANKILLSFFWSVFQSVITIQSEAALFTAACGGDIGLTARAFSGCSGLVGVGSLFVNQAGGKLSDAIGRKKLFLLGPVRVLPCPSPSRAVFAPTPPAPPQLVQIVSKYFIFRSGSSSLALLMVTKILNLTFNTFSGSTMSMASLMDFSTAPEMAQMGAQLQTSAGIAVVVAPFVEVELMKRLGGDGRNHFAVSCAMNILQLAYMVVALPETLALKKRISMSKFMSSLSSLNPLSFIKVFRGKNKVLKQLLLVNTLQCCTEGRCTSECFQLWGKLDMMVTPGAMRNMLMYWGATVSGFGLLGSPILLRNFSPYMYTTITNLAVFTGLCIKGMSIKPPFFYAAYAVCMAGVNGSSTHAVKAMAGAHAMKDGYGRGEYSAWVQNLRSISTAACTVAYGWWYGYCTDKGWWTGSVWWFMAILGGLIPQLMVWSIPKEAFEMPKE
jgi:hypothetical protein